MCLVLIERCVTSFNQFEFQPSQTRWFVAQPVGGFLLYLNWDGFNGKKWEEIIAKKSVLSLKKLKIQRRRNFLAAIDGFLRSVLMKIYSMAEQAVFYSRRDLKSLKWGLLHEIHEIEFRNPERAPLLLCFVKWVQAIDH